VPRFHLLSQFVPLGFQVIHLPPQVRIACPPHLYLVSLPSNDFPQAGEFAFLRVL
jgi:hypothetical protein